MRHRAAWILGVILLSLVFQGDSCVLEQRTVSAILGTSVPAEFSSVGNTESTDSDVETVDLAAEIKAAIEDIDVADIAAIYVSGGCYEVDASTGRDCRRDGTVELDGNLFLSFDVPTNAAGTKGSTGDGTLSLHEPGVTYLNNLLNTYLDALQADQDPPLSIAYAAEWTSSNCSGPAGDNFQWRVCVNLQVDYKIEIDVPNP